MSKGLRPLESADSDECVVDACINSCNDDCAVSDEQFKLILNGKNIQKKEDLSKSIEKVNHPIHYNLHPSGVECIDIVRHYCFSIGNVIKYCWRAGLKKENGYSDIKKELEDLKKARFYLDDRISQLEKEMKGSNNE